jgi:site-specific recombinase XerD
MRVTELCWLKKNCLIQDRDGDWFLHYHQWKLRKDISIPVTHNTADVIQWQQNTVRIQWGNTCPWLFPDENGEPLTPKNFNLSLNQLAEEKQICDADGKLYATGTTTCMVLDLPAA